jgi:hypothetical protein
MDRRTDPHFFVDKFDIVGSFRKGTFDNNNTYCSRNFRGVLKNPHKVSYRWWV